jgi:hypothetical protein
MARFTVAEEAHGKLATFVFLAGPVDPSRAISPRDSQLDRVVLDRERGTARIRIEAGHLRLNPDARREACYSLLAQMVHRPTCWVPRPSRRHEAILAIVLFTWRYKWVQTTRNI